MDIGFVSALIAGAISFLSPCVLPLVPPYLCYMAGVSVEEFRAGGEASAPSDGAGARCSARLLAFVLGFTGLRGARRGRRPLA